MKKIIVFVFLSLVANISYALEEVKVQDFFNRYQQLSNEFDTGVIALYADDAKISTERKYPSGKIRKTSVSGKQWTLMVGKMLSESKKRGDINSYSNTEITIDENTARIDANRYSQLKNYTDNEYYMVLKESSSGALIIVEEHFQTQPQTDQITGDLQKMLEFQQNKIRGYLPLKVDEDTRLDSVLVEDGRLTYYFTLVTIAKGELDIDQFDVAMLEMLAGQACNQREMNQILDNSGTIGYMYKDMNGDTLSALQVSSADCS